MPAHRKRTQETDDAFFAALARGDTICNAARLTGCSRQALYRRRIKDRAFDRRWREAEAAARAKTRKAKRKRPGYTLPFTAPRGVRGHKKIVSNGQLMARLKAVRPQYREERSAPQPVFADQGPVRYNIVHGDPRLVETFKRLVRERRPTVEDVPETMRGAVESEHKLTEEHTPTKTVGP